MPPAPPPQAPEVSAEMLGFVAQYMARPEGEHLMAMDDDMRREMVLLTHVLAPRAGATHVAVQSGDWSDPTTWIEVAEEDFGVPGAGAKVLIPEGVEVTYDVLSDDPIGYIRQDGRFTFPHDRSTRLVVDTIVQDHGHGNCGCSPATCPCSRFQIGSADNPVDPDHSCEIIFPGETDLDPTVDTLLIGRGFISMGKVAIYGAPKTAWVKCSQNRPVGATTITLDEVPSGWRVGDEILIGGTDVNTSNAFNNSIGGVTIARTPRHDDYVTITAIDGATITFTPALEWSRDIREVAGFEGMFYPVSNFTRNVTFSSPDDTPIHRRGHLMFMHDEAHCEYADARSLGRTRKDIVSWSATNDARRILVMGGDVPWAPDSNLRGRYNWHLHRAGTQPGQATAEMIGLAADANGAGWANAHHSSVANWRWCVARRFFGAGFVAEVGDEIGLWEHCVSMSAGQGARPPSNAGEKTTEDFSNDSDFARSAAGFWGRGRAVVVQHCVAVDCSSGYVWITRGAGSQPRADRMPVPRAFYRSALADITVSIDAPPVWDFIGNRAIACQTAKQIIKAGPTQGMNLRSNFFNLIGWNIGGLGVAVEYTGQYSYRDIRMLRTTVGGSGGASRGFQIGQNSLDFSVEDLLIRGWNNAIQVRADDGPRADFRFVNTDYTGNLRHSSLGTISEDWNEHHVSFHPPFAPETRDTFDYVPDGPLVWGGSHTAGISLQGTITDALGTHTRRNNFTNLSGPGLSGNTLIDLVGAYGYWTHDGKRYLLLPDVIKRRWISDGGAGAGDTVYFTQPVDVTARSPSGLTNNGPLPERYINPDNSVKLVVFEDILDILENGP